MTKLLKVPCEVKFDELIVRDVTEVLYVDNKLKIKFMPTDFKASNHIAVTSIWKEVTVVSHNGVGITYHLKNTSPRFAITMDEGIAFYTLIFYVERPVIGLLDV
jgi:hypothetical protein